MSQFQNKAFQFDFVKCLLRILRQSVAMATDLSFHFICRLLRILESFILSKSILIICSQVNHILNKSLWHLEFSHLDSN